MIQGQFVGVDEVIAKISVAKAQLAGPTMRGALEKVGSKSVNILKGYLPTKTGRTRQTAGYDVAGSELTVGLGATTPPGLGKWLVDGTGPHMIQGSPLRFQASGEVVYRPKVHHPGTKPLDLSRAQLEIERAAESAVADELRMLEPQLSD